MDAAQARPWGFAIAFTQARDLGRRRHRRNVLNRHPHAHAARALLAGLLTASIATAAPAFAQTDKAGGEGTPKPNSGEGSAAEGNPNPPPPVETKAKEEVEKDPGKAKEAEKKSELTPIVPSPNDPYKPAFQLYSEIDIPVLAVGTVFAAARLIRTQKAYCAPLCDKSELNGLDRLTAGRYNTTWSFASDLGLYGIGLGAAVVFAADEGLAPALNDGVVIAQSALLSTAISSILTLAAGRPRPFLYSENAPESVRNSTDASLSFLSSHASVSFAIATSSYMAMRRLHPDKPAYSWWTLGIGLTIASFVGAARVMAGKHFITDAVGGAVVGSATGVLIPALHSAPVKIVPQLTPDTKVIALVGWF